MKICRLCGLPFESGEIWEDEKYCDACLACIVIDQEYEDEAKENPEKQLQFQ